MSKDSNVVLIIEDEQEYLEKRKKIIQSSGYICMTASNGHEGLDVLSKNIGVVDVVLLDLFMDDIDGLQVLKAIKSNPNKYGNMPVIILTNMTSQNIIQEAFDLGISSYLIKDQINNNVLIEELKKYI